MLNSNLETNASLPVGVLQIVAEGMARGWFKGGRDPL